MKMETGIIYKFYIKSVLLNKIQLNNLTFAGEENGGVCGE